MKSPMTDCSCDCHKGEAPCASCHLCYEHHKPDYVKKVEEQL